MIKDSNNHHHPHVQGRVMLSWRLLFDYYVKVNFFRSAIKKLIELGVDLWARVVGFRFPGKYPWDWKLEMLTYRFEPDTVKLARAIIKPGMVVVDIGAHIGYFTRIFSRLTGDKGKVVAFEPTSENFSLLEKNLQGKTNAVLVNKAVSDKEGEITFYKTKGRSGCHSIIKQEEKSEALSVPTVSLENYLLKAGINHVDFIKMDIEGGESVVLEGSVNFLKKTKDLTIVMEFNHIFFERQNKDPKQFFSFVENLGFSIFYLEGGKLVPLDKNKWQLLPYDNEEYINLVYRK